jgi:hypothetical protein
MTDGWEPTAGLRLMGRKRGHKSGPLGRKPHHCGLARAPYDVGGRILDSRVLPIIRRTAAGVAVPDGNVGANVYGGLKGA